MQGRFRAQNHKNPILCYFCWVRINNGISETNIIINGPNLNLLGKREPEIYGNMDFEGFFKQLQEEFEDLDLSYYQSNAEGELVTKIQEVGFSYDGIVLNPAGYSHTSVAIADAVAAINCPVVEVHISNIFGREAFRQHSYVSPGE